MAHVSRLSLGIRAQRDHAIEAAAEATPNFGIEPEFSPVELYHDDDCGEALVDGMCPKCGFAPDMQSTAFRAKGEPRG